jgi:hypothetical protein
LFPSAAFAGQNLEPDPDFCQASLLQRTSMRRLSFSSQPQLVAQASSLPHRGFPIRCRSEKLEPAGWKPAIRQVKDEKGQLFNWPFSRAALNQNKTSHRPASFVDGLGRRGNQDFGVMV